MAVEVPAFPTYPQHTIVVVLDGVQYRLVFTYRARMQGWYFDLGVLDAVGGVTKLVSGRRVSPDWTPLVSLVHADAPPGVVYIRGPDAYDQPALGNTVRVFYYDVAELVAANPVDDDGVRVVVD